MNAVKVHTCIGQERVAIGEFDPPAPACNCRRMIFFKEADEIVKSGQARWVVVKRVYGETETICGMCLGDTSIKNCAQCNGKGKIVTNVVWDTYNNDITLVNLKSINDKRYRSRLAPKTPRVATIESEHIEYAIIEGRTAAADRIRLYGDMCAEELGKLGAQLRRGDKIVKPGNPEPENDRKKGTGRDYDWGRLI